MEGDQTIGENNNPVVPKPDQPSHTYEMKVQQQNMTLDPTIEYETDLLQIQDESTELNKKIENATRATELLQHYKRTLDKKMVN